MTKIDFYQDIGIFHQAVDDTVCNGLINLFETSEYKARNYSIPDRVDLAKGFDFKEADDLKKLKIKLITCLRQYASKYIGLHQYGLISSECKIQKTLRYNGFHNWHHEHNIQEQNMKRVLVWMVYLNDMEPQDGTTEFLHQELEVQPQQGTLVIWPAYFNYIHRGNPPRKNIKYISTGWWHHVEISHPFNELATEKTWNSSDNYFT